MIMVEIAIILLAVIAFFILILIMKGGVLMLNLTKDNPVVLAWYTWVTLYGNPIENVPERWGLRKLVQELINENE